MANILGRALAPMESQISESVHEDNLRSSEALWAVSHAVVVMEIHFARDLLSSLPHDLTSS